jgi:hypothetical protein
VVTAQIIVVGVKITQAKIRVTLALLAVICLMTEAVSALILLGLTFLIRDLLFHKLSIVIHRVQCTILVLINRQPGATPLGLIQ